MELLGDLAPELVRVVDALLVPAMVLLHRPAVRVGADPRRRSVHVRHDGDLQEQPEVTDT